MLPSDLPFWYWWEVHRLAPLLEELPFELNKLIRKHLRKVDVSPAEFWDGVRQICSDKRIQVPRRSNIPAWATSGRYEDESTNKAVYLTGSLDWEDDPAKSLFKLSLNPIHLEQSCRFTRKFGADRFMVISVPLFPEDHIPDKVCPKSKRQAQGPILFEKITTFLASNMHQPLWKVPLS